MGVLLMGIAAALFIAASEFFLLAKECDVYSIPEGLARNLPDFYKALGEDWAGVKNQIDRKCETYSDRAKNCYNYGIFIVFVGIWFVVGSYNFVISTIILALGIGLESYEWFGRTTKAELGRPKPA